MILRTIKQTVLLAAFAGLLAASTTLTEDLLLRGK